MVIKPNGRPASSAGKRACSQGLNTLSGFLYSGDGSLVREFRVNDLLDRKDLAAIQDIGFAGQVDINMPKGKDGWTCLGATPGDFGYIPIGEQRITAVAFSDDKQKLIVSYYSYQQWVLLALIDISPSGDLSLNVEATACLQRKGSEPHLNLAPKRGPVAALRFSRDGKRFIAAGRDGGAGVFELEDESGGEKQQYRLSAELRSKDDIFVDVTWDADGNAITASSDGTLKRWSLRPKTYTTETANPRSKSGPAYPYKSLTSMALKMKREKPEEWVVRNAQGNKVSIFRWNAPVVSPCSTYILDRSERPGKLLSGDATLLAHISGPADDKSWRGAVRFSANEDFLFTEGGQTGGGQEDLRWPLSAAEIVRFVDEHNLPSEFQRFTSEDLRRYGITE